MNYFDNININIITPSNLQKNIPLYFFNDLNINNNFYMIESVEAISICKKWTELFSYKQNLSEPQSNFKDNDKIKYNNYLKNLNNDKLNISGHKFIIWKPYIGNHVIEKYKENIAVIKYIDTFNSIKVTEIIFSPLWELNNDTIMVDIRKYIIKYFIEYAKYKFVKFDL